MSIHQFISENIVGRDFVVGDIHGCFDLLNGALTYAGFDRTRDRLFSVGDIIDRGPQSEQCISLLDEPWFFMVKGNHEQLCIEACKVGSGHNWWSDLGRWTKWIDDTVVIGWADRLDKLPVSMTLQCDGYTVGICHAEPDGQNWHRGRDSATSQNVMLWGRRVLSGAVDYDVEGVDITIHGHTPLDAPKWVGNRYFLDTNAWCSGMLTLRKISDIHDEYTSTRSLFR